MANTAQNRPQTPIALTIAGSDSSGGAGIQADLKAFSALGAYGASCITAITAQNTRQVSAVAEVTADMVAAQIDAVFDDLEVGAVKVGMLSSTAIIDTVVTGLAERGIPIVVDPVMVSKSGHSLLQDSAADALRERLLPLATLLTPNLPEAARLCGREMAFDEAAIQQQAELLIEAGARAVLMKGGHSQGETCVDLLVTAEGVRLRLEAERIDTKNTHGTGCTLSSAIAAGFARGLPLEQAVGSAHDYLQGAIRAADQLQVGHGYGPVHHFYRQWD